MAPSNGRRKPNILITGTPGTGKTTTALALAEATQFRHINFGDLVKEKNLHDGWDDDFDCYIINENLVASESEIGMVTAFMSRNRTHGWKRCRSLVVLTLESEEAV